MSDRPNLLFVTTDQQGFDALHCAGNQQIFTPHLDWLADNGIRFTNAYSDCPVCVPARVTMMSGRHAWHHRVLSNRWVDGAYTPATGLAGLLGAAGYQTALIGKNHTGRSRRHRNGFQTLDETEHYYRFHNRYPELGRPRANGAGLNEHCPAIDTVGEEHSLSHWCVERTMDYLETRDPSRPFFVWLSFDDPHPPLTPAASYWQLYHGQPVPAPIRGDWSRDHADIPPAWQGVTWELAMAQRLQGERLAQARRAYYALVTQIDYHLGILWGHLREQGLLENTWIVFTSDHGEMLGDHHLGGKCVPFEGSAHVPLLVRPPAAPRDTGHPLRGSLRDDLVCHADLLPTFCALAGADTPDALDGTDLLAAERAPRERLFGSCMYLHYLREGRFKYCRETLGGHELCFDLAADPDETRDLIAAGEEADAAARLRATLDAHLDAEDLRDACAHDPGTASSDQAMPRNVHPGHWTTRAFGC